MKNERGAWLTWITRGCAALGLLFLLLPLLVVLPASFEGASTMHVPPHRWSVASYGRIIAQPAWSDPLRRSLGIAVATAVLSMTFGLIGAYGMRQLSLFWSLTVHLFLFLPLIVPPVVMGCNLLLALATLDLVDTSFGIVLGHLLLALPYAVLVSSASMARTDMRLEDIACVCGATRWTAMLRVTLPQMWWGIVAGLFLTFMVSFDEPVISLFLGTAEARTLPRRLFDSIRYDFDPSAAAVASLACVVLFGAAAWSACIRNDEDAVSRGS